MRWPRTPAGNIATLKPIQNTGISHSSCDCSAKRRKPGALDLLSKFVETAKADGVVRKALDLHGFKTAEVAPAA